MEGRGSETILVLEDDPTVCRLVCDVLADCGYRTLPTDGRERALELAGAEARLDLVLADVSALAGSAGEFVRLLRERHPDLRVLYMSGHRREELARRDPSTQGMPLLEKPFPLQLLGQAVREAVDAGRAGSG